MTNLPTLDWTCARCGNTERLQLVNAPTGQEDAGVRHPHPDAPTLDWTCSRCGTTETYRLVPMRERA